MKIKHPFIIGLLVITIPILVGVMFIKDDEPKKEQLATVKRIPRPKPVSPAFRELLAEYEKKVGELAHESHTPGYAVAVVHDSSIVYLKGFGIRTAGKPDSVDVKTVFRIASVSKCFGAFLTGILVEDSILRWDDTVIRYLPKFALKSPEETQKLTIRNVLSHTTGLPYHAYTNMVEEGAPLDTMIAWLKNIDMASRVGQSYSYQNVAYSIIGPVIKTKTGRTYETELIERVFKPLEMSTASVDYATIIGNPNIAMPHKMQRRQWVPARLTNTYYNVAPAGGVNASITDMAHWMIALLGNREDVISKKTLEYLFSPHTKAPSKNRNYGRMHRLSSSYYGLGWRVLYYPNDTLIYHGGFVNGYRSEVAVNPKEKIAVCILSNAPGEVADNGIPLFFNLYESRRDSIIAWEKRRLTGSKKMLP